MRRLLLLILLAIFAPGQLAAATWLLDPAASSIEVIVNQGGRPLTARFERFEADIRFDPAALETSQVEIRVDVASFTSGDTGRDAQARGAPWLDSGGHATAVYRTLTMRRAHAAEYEVDAELTLRGTSRRLLHAATIVIDGDRATATGSLPLARLDFGIGQGADPSGQAVGLEVIVRFTLAAQRG